ncbi:2-hydroxyacid dehydrogenase [Asticcacaulis benevestitus]|uniref:2-hydroxyacid dehydrogenase n=1 Tax=Asticcacaulis benevestitus TaxID=347481 RepID=UPI001F46AF55|nr:D-glycerate dehydrogenase [Asticcacaulis benevestitus]
MSRRWPPSVEAELRTRYHLTVNDDDRPLTRQQLAEAMARFDAVCPTVSDRIDADMLNRPDRRVKILANYGAGFEHIDLEAARAAGIIVTNTPDVLTDATAELALLLMLTASRRTGEGERQLRAGEWSGWRPTHLLGRSLRGRQLGLIGFGRIAQATAKLAVAALGMKIAYHSRRPATDVGLAARYMPDLDDLLASSDVVSLHCPGGAQTHHLIERRRLALMKPSAILINTARGTVVNEADLADALKHGVIAAAGLDVYEGEPQIDAHLLAQENAVLLPHLGSATLEARTAMGNKVVANLDRFFAGDAVIDQVI